MTTITIALNDTLKFLDSLPAPANLGEKENRIALRKIINNAQKYNPLPDLIESLDDLLWATDKVDSFIAKSARSKAKRALNKARGVE